MGIAAGPSNRPMRGLNTKTAQILHERAANEFHEGTVKVASVSDKPGGESVVLFPRPAHPVARTHGAPQ